MFRTVTVYRGEKLTVRQGWMIVSNENGEQKLPIEDLYSVVIDNPQTVISTAAITQLTASGAHILVCNEKHLPVSVILPHNTHYHPLTVLRSQLSLPAEIRDRLWERIVKAKIENQALVLQYCGCEERLVSRLQELEEEVVNADEGNREGIAARLFFRGLYGAEFIRMNDDAINAALNYGYTVIRSAVAKTLTAYGYNCVLGLHHINESNAFNLADDMMEPLRPLVDLWVSENGEDLVDELTKQQKNELASLVNDVVLWNGKRMRVRNAIDKYISSLTTAITHCDPKSLLLPTVIRHDCYRDEDDV